MLPGVRVTSARAVSACARWLACLPERHDPPGLPTRLARPGQVALKDRGPKRVFGIHHVSEPDSTSLRQ
jgi:hypothetical protein